MEKAAFGGLTFGWQRYQVLWVAVSQADVIEFKPLDTVHGGEAEWSGVVDVPGIAGDLMDLAALLLWAQLRAISIFSQLRAIAYFRSQGPCISATNHRADCAAPTKFRLPAKHPQEAVPPLGAPYA